MESPTPASQEATKWIHEKTMIVDHKSFNCTKGKFSQAEIDLLTDSIREFAAQNNLKEQDLLNLVSSDTCIKSKGLWTFLHECLPHRSLQSLKSLCQRRFNSQNYQGKWSDDEVQCLIDLVQKYGCKWQKLSQIMNRTPTNIRDKWRSIGDVNYNKRRHEKVWSVDDVIKMIRLIERLHGVKIFKNSTDEPILREFLSFKERCPYLQAGQDNKNLNAFCRKIIKSFMVPETLTIVSSLKFKWNKIALEMETKSKDDCRNYWRSQILKELGEKPILKRPYGVSKRIMKQKNGAFTRIKHRELILKETKEAEFFKMNGSTVSKDKQSYKDLSELASQKALPQNPSDRTLLSVSFRHQ